MLQYQRTWVFRILLWSVLFLWVLPINSVKALSFEENDDSLSVITVPQARAAVLIEAHSGEVLFAVNEDTLLPPASTTKILTALLALDLDAQMDRLRLISKEAADVGDMSLHLKAGERLSLNDLLKGALVHSGNDACYAIGEIIAGNETLFVHWMNMKAAVLGAYSVHMDNTNGLPSPDHLMSALDLAILSRYAMNNSFFSQTVKSKYIHLGQGKSIRSYQNTNKLLWQDAHVVGIKTGTTDAAGPCLVAAYEDGAALLISVVLNSTDRYGESAYLLKYGMDTYQLIYLPCKGEVLAYYSAGKGGVRLAATTDLSVLVKEEELADLRLIWHVSGDGGFLKLKNNQGNELGGITLMAQTKVSP